MFHVKQIHISAHKQLFGCCFCLYTYQSIDFLFWMLKGLTCLKQGFGQRPERTLSRLAAGKYVHKLLSSDGLLLQQILRKFMQLADIFLQDALGLFIRLADDANGL